MIERIKRILDLNDRLASVQQDVIMLKSDSRHTRDQLHDLQLGQRLLPVRDEIADEITNICKNQILSICNKR